MKKLLPALALLLLIIAQAEAQNVIRGKVRSTNHGTVNGAIVELRGGAGSVLGQTVTRTDGDFYFPNLSPGAYEIEVTMTDYVTQTQTVEVVNNIRGSYQEVVSVEFVLRPKPGSATTPPGTNFVQDVPKAARTSYEKATVKLREGKSDEAVALLREAIAGFGDYFQAHLALAGELYRLNKYDEAVQSLEQARLINDRDATVYYLFGLVMVKQRKFTAAEYAFRGAISYNVNHAGSHYYRGLALIEMGFHGDAKHKAENLAEAERELGRALELSQSRMSEVYLQRARIYESRKEYEAAARELESFLRAEPNAKNAPVVREAVVKLRAEKK
jgi:Tfp pilus assembly protein PilF